MIEWKNLTKQFGYFRAVDRVSFSVGKRSIVGFLGPNGSGKTTVIRMLCGILDPNRGRVQVARIARGAVVSGADRLPKAMTHLDKALRLKPDDTGRRASLQVGRRVLAELQAGGATAQR